MRLLTASLFFALFSVALPEPAVAQKVSDLRQSHASLQRQLAHTENGLPLPAADKIDLLQAFLDAHRDHQSHTLVLQARSRLGDLYLLRREPSALAEFTAILASAQSDQRDLRSRARYGQAQANLQQGRVEQARQLLLSLVRDEPATRYGRYARIALSHLDRADRVPRPGLPLAPITFGRDLSGKVHSTATLQGSPALLVFWSPDSPSSLVLTERLAEIWNRDGPEEKHFLTLALHRDANAVRDLARERGWTFPVILCDGGFLDPIALTLGLRGVPSSLLLGPDSTLLARDLSAGRLSNLLDRGMGR